MWGWFWRIGIFMIKISIMKSKAKRTWAYIYEFGKIESWGEIIWSDGDFRATENLE